MNEKYCRSGRPCPTLPVYDRGLFLVMVTHSCHIRCHVVVSRVRGDGQPCLSISNIDQTAHKYEMRINENMEIGFVKNELLFIMIESDMTKRLQRYNSMVSKI
jgi:hypothetical protein